MAAITGSRISDQDLAEVQRRNRGRSWVEGIKMVGRLALTIALVAVLACIAIPASVWLVIAVSGFAWLVGAAFVFFFFRDATPQPPAEPGVVLSPSHGTIDYIDTTAETHFPGGPARRISIYLSLLNVHVQHAPVSGKVEVLQHFPGRWSRAIRRDASLRNEHLLVGLSFGEGRTMALRLISGIWVRRIVPWVAHGQQIIGGERIGLIRFGSRVDVLLPLDARVSVKPGDKVRGGETILARFPEELLEGRS